MTHPRLIESLRSKPTRSNTGAAREMAVAADLLSKGWEVFRSCGPNSKADIVARAEYATVLFIEVRTISQRSDGTLQPNIHKDDHCDLYAGVHDGQVLYFDALTVANSARAKGSVKGTGRGGAK